MAYPATWPRSLIAVATAFGPPNVPRSVGVPFRHSTACWLLLVSPQPPMTWPLLLIAVAPQPLRLLGAGSWVMVPLESTQACEPVLSLHAPAICPASLIPYAPSPPKEVIFVPFHKNEEEPVAVSTEPTTWPDRLIEFPWL